LEALGVPVLKGDKPQEVVGSYRPVELTALLCRITERLSLRRMLPSVVAQLALEQCGFLPGRSCDEVLIALVADLQSHLPVFTRADARKTGATSAPSTATRADDRTRMQRIIVVAACDFSDAFCRVSANDIIDRMIALGLDGFLVRWVSVFLSGRSFRVRWRGRLSAAFLVELGVPQGSILGPFLWLLVADILSRRLKNHIAGLNGCGNSRFAWVADDLTIWCWGDTLPEASATMRKLLAVVSGWAEQHHIVVSSKTDVLWFGGAEPTKEEIAAAVG
jgi:hypothetical protein